MILLGNLLYKIIYLLRFYCIVMLVKITFIYELFDLYLEKTSYRIILICIKKRKIYR